MSKKILAIDTSSQIIAIALGDQEKVFWAENKEGQMRHIENLFTLIRKGLAAVEWQVNDLEAIAIGVGPGSFTGLRVGIAAVKGLALAQRRLKVVAVSSMDFIAANVYEAQNLIVANDARRERMYISIYKKENGIWKRKGNDALVSLAEFHSTIGKIRKPVHVCGNVLRAYPDLLDRKEIICCDEDMWYPHAKTMMRVAARMVVSKEWTPLRDLNPAYLSLSAAEEKQKSGTMHKKKASK